MNYLVQLIVLLKDSKYPGNQYASPATQGIQQSDSSEATEHSREPTLLTKHRQIF